MSKENLCIPYLHYASLEALPEVDQALIRAAREACQRAYAPYSGFRVGAAALLESGRLLSASNQESEVFPSGMCAERILLYQLQANHSGERIVALAVVSEPHAEAENRPTADEETSLRECYPCGACRQVLFDTEKRQGAPLRIVMCGPNSASVVESARDLLPFTFSL